MKKIKSIFDEIYKNLDKNKILANTSLNQYLTHLVISIQEQNPKIPQDIYLLVSREFESNARNMGEGTIIINNYLLHGLDNEDQLAYMEQYKPLKGRGGAKINNLIFLELDENRKLVQFNKIEKEIKILRTSLILYGKQINRIGGFDYSGYQDLGNGDYLFFYYKKQKPEERGKKQWVLGIISHIDGKFSEQKLPLKSEDGSDLFITPAKKGYVMIYETFKDKDRSSEIRLEKINY